MMKKTPLAMLLLSIPLMMPAAAYDGQQTTVKVPSLMAGVGFNEQYHHRQIALWSLRQIHANIPLVDDPWSVQLLHVMVNQMNATVRQQPVIAMPLINDNQVNAFAVPGGVIGLNTGVVLSADGLDEVASVLAHEIAHLSQRHYEQRADNHKKLLAWQLGGLLTALAASAVGGDAVLAVMAGSQAGMAESVAAHSREHEREADRVGQQILSKSGYDAHAMPRFFHQLHRQVSLNQSSSVFIPSFMQSHPFTMERLSEATARASRYPTVPMSDKQNQARLFDLLYWRLKYLTRQTNLSELTVNVKQSQGARLALAMFFMDDGQYDQAQKTLDEGNFTHDELLFVLVQADLLNAQHRYEEAVRLLKPLQAIYPERRDVRLYLAKNLIATQQAPQAIALLQDLTKKTSHDVQAWQLMQRAYESKAYGDHDERSQEISTIYALQARSWTEFWTDKHEAALRSNAQALKIANAHKSLQSLVAMLQADKEQIVMAKDFKPRF